MAASERSETVTTAIERIDQLIALFNRKGMDLPDQLFERTTQFLLNGAPYETLLGQPPTDPLILMLTRGPAGYRFIAKAVQHAVPDAAIQRGELIETSTDLVYLCEFWLSGHLRESSEPIQLIFRTELFVTPTGSVRKVDVKVDESALGKLRDARHKP